MDIYLMYGGKNAEHDVSVASAYHIINNVNYDYHQVIPVYITIDGKWQKSDAINSKKTILSFPEFKTMNTKGFSLSELKREDVMAFPVLHGPNGEDGTIQGFFELFDIPYVGNGVLSSSIGMDKIISKILFEAANIPIVPYKVVLQNDWDKGYNEELDDIINTLHFPMFVKPANLGSSVGISEANNYDELKNAIELALQYDYRILIEKGIKCKELEIAVLGNDEIITSVIGSIDNEKRFYDYESKYLSQEIILEIPAKISKDVISKIEEYARKAYKVLDCSGLSRIDFFIADNQEIYINEINTFPGFTPTSMYPKLWEKSGLTSEIIIDKLIELALEKHNFKKSRISNIN